MTRLDTQSLVLEICIVVKLGITSTCLLFFHNALSFSVRVTIASAYRSMVPKYLFQYIDSFILERSDRFKPKPESVYTRASWHSIIFFARHFNWQIMSALHTVIPIIMSGSRRLTVSEIAFF